MKNENGHDVQKTQQRRTKSIQSLSFFFETLEEKEEFFKNSGKIQVGLILVPKTKY